MEGAGIEGDRATTSFELETVRTLPHDLRRAARS
jgi:hypothetical protein